jgi:hypothetical protein
LWLAAARGEIAYVHGIQGRHGIPRRSVQDPEMIPDYCVCSQFILERIEGILNEAISGGANRIIININLRHGLPWKNINKIAGPFVEAWSFEVFQNIANEPNNDYELINVEAKERLYMADITLQFKNQRRITRLMEGILVRRTALEFCQLLDQKYLNSSKRSFKDWLALAVKHGWVKTND